MHAFSWEDLGNVEEGRMNLGASLPVRVYRLMQYTLREVLSRRYGGPTADRLFVEAGFVAGVQFCRSVLDRTLNTDAFVAQLKQKLEELKIGLLRIEKFDMEHNDIVVTVAEDLDCSGLPMRGETVCRYDEGFLGGILTEYSGKRFEAREVDCWASGERVCRFVVRRSDK